MSLLLRLLKSNRRMECRLRATPEQFMILLKYMETHGDLGRPHPGLPGRVKCERLWQPLGKMLNSCSGGVVKSLEKWKKVWADWKAKTKKKALRIRRDAPNGRSGTKLALTGPEKRVLGVMGIKAAFGLKSIKVEKESDEEPSNRDPLSPNTADPGQSDFSSYSVKNEVMLDYVPIYSTEKSSTANNTPQPSSEQIQHPSPYMPTPPPAHESTPMPPLNDTVSQGMARRWRPIPRIPESSTAANLRRLRLLRARTQRERTSFQRSTNEFVSIEAARLRLEAEREKNEHRKEMERLRLEARRIEMEENRNNTLNHMVIVLDKLTEILPQLRTAIRSTIAVPIENYSV